MQLAAARGAAWVLSGTRTGRATAALATIPTSCPTHDRFGDVEILRTQPHSLENPG